MKFFCDAYLTFTDTGLATAIAEGAITISVSTAAPGGEALTAEHNITVQADSVPPDLMMIRKGKICATSSYVLEGDFTVQAKDDELIIDINSIYRAYRSYPGLYILHQ